MINLNRLAGLDILVYEEEISKENAVLQIHCGYTCGSGNVPDNLSYFSISIFVLFLLPEIFSEPFFHFLFRDRYYELQNLSPRNPG